MVNLLHRLSFPLFMKISYNFHGNYVPTRAKNNFPVVPHLNLYSIRNQY